MPSKPTPDLSVTIAGRGEYVDARSFIETVTDAIDAIEQIDTKLSSVDAGSIKWEVINATVNSPVVLEFHGAPQVVGDFTEPVVETFVGGMEQIDRTGKVPKNFPPEAVNAIARLAHRSDNGISKITFKTKTREYSPSPRLAKRLDAILKTDVQQAATPSEFVENGNLDGIVENLFGRELHFTLYESLSNSRVRCDFPAELSEDARVVWKKRAVVDGLIRYSVDGKPLKMTVTAISLKPSRDTLPQFKGVYLDITGGVESSAYVRGLRDDD